MLNLKTGGNGITLEGMDESVAWNNPISFLLPSIFFSTKISPSFILQHLNFVHIISVSAQRIPL